MSRWYWLCLTLLQAGASVESSAAVDFPTEIWPILQARCLECHGPQAQKSSFRVDSRAALLRGGDLGPAIVPGDPAKSYLIQAVTSEDAEVRMPHKGKPLTAPQIRALREWIAGGADWPAGIGAAAQSAHWSFQPVTRPTPPSLKDSGIKNSIDAFLVDRLAQSGLHMSPEADGRTFIRRATLDLTGLPPTPEEVAEFLAQSAFDPRLAIDSLIDRLLASPRYGERWAQHWLDVIRYADTTGYEKNSIRPSAWPYRDYVIAALNADIPYPQFILEQLAGDTLGVDAATGFLVTAPFPSRIEIGQEETAILQARFNGLDEVLQNVASALLGVTVGCARCHDHKFDPVSTRDYYRLAATFAGLQFVDRPWRDGALPVEETRASEQRLAGIRRQLRSFPAWREIEPTQAADFFRPVRARYVRLRVTNTFTGRKYPPAFNEIEVWTPATPNAPARNVGSAREGAVARSSGAALDLPSQDGYLNDGASGWRSLWVSDNPARPGQRVGQGETWVEIELREPMEIDRVSWSCEYDDQGPDRVPLRWRFVTDWTIEVAEEPGEWRMVVSEDRSEGLPQTEQSLRTRLENQFAAAATDLWDLTHVFAGSFRSPPDAMHVLIRGDPQQPREPIGPGGIDALLSYELPAETPETARREALARWLGSPQHPLTARVLVNRVWRHHFGAGLVETPSDFGTQGERPTHPELLDWLASEFVSRGWRLKDLHRLICTSAAYRQSSRPAATASRIDADARLLWRFPPRRLEAEAIRDSVLQASGSLDLRMGGPGANLYKPRRKSDAGEWAPLETPGPESWRRSIYLLRVRGADDGVFKPFDLPDCGQVRAKRSESTTPLQALNLFNSPFIIEQAQRLAARAGREAGDDLDQQVERIYLLTLARAPSDRERRDCLAVARKHGLATVCRALFNSNEFLFLE